MNISHTDTRVLLIGCGLRQIDRMIETLNLVGAELLFADDATEALRLIGLGAPDIVVCHVNLPDADAAGFCSAIRADDQLKHIPVLFAGESTNGIAGVFNAFTAGADDFITEHFDSNAFLAKLVWMMEQRSDEIAQRKQYESLRRSQMQTLDIVRETTAMFRSMNFDKRSGGPDLAQLDERIEMGLGMIAGLANLLEEQIKAADTWFGTGEEAKQAVVEYSPREPMPVIEAPLELPLAA